MLYPHYKWFIFQPAMFDDTGGYPGLPPDRHPRSQGSFCAAGDRLGFCGALEWLDLWDLH